MTTNRLLKFIVSLEFISVMFITLYFYAANWSAGLGLVDMPVYQTYTLFIAYAALLVSLIASVALLWRNHPLFLRQKAKSLLAIIILIIVLVTTQDTGIVGSFIIGLALLGSNDTKVFKSILFSSSILFVITAILGSELLIAGNKYDTGLFGAVGVYKDLYALGFTNPNVTYQYFLPILLSALYLSNRKRVIVLFLIISTILGIITGSMTGFLVAVVACAAFATIGKRTSGRATKAIAPYGMIIAIVATFIIASGALPNYDSINEILTGRPAFWELRVENGSYLNLFGDSDQYQVHPSPGQRFCDYEGSGNAIWCFPLDNAPLYIAVHYGLVMLTIYTLIYFKAGKVIKDVRLLVIGLILLLVFMFERTNFMNNIYLLFAIKHLAEFYIVEKPGIRAS